jgi:hypothetical protein
MNPCLKTGANVWLQSHSCVLHGDLFKVGSTWMLHHTGMENAVYNAFDALSGVHANFFDNDAERAHEERNLFDLTSKNVILLQDDYVYPSAELIRILLEQ